MSKVGIVSCNKWIGKIKEDINLRDALNKLNISSDIVSWQQPLKENYDLLILRSVWGYQDDYKKFKEWLLYLKNNNISLLNNPDMIISNILKDKQFEILEKYGVEYIKTYFLKQTEFNTKNILMTLNELLNGQPSVVKPTISGSGENTYLTNYQMSNNIPNMISSSDILMTFEPILKKNLDCGIMFQPYISEINEGEYSCIFIGGELTHTMLRFPAIFHEKKRPYLISDVPKEILKLANKVQNIPEFSNYLYMRVDMVLVDNEAKIMEVELAEPDLLTKYIDDSQKQTEVIKILAKKIEGRIM